MVDGSSPKLYISMQRPNVEALRIYILPGMFVAEIGNPNSAPILFEINFHIYSF